MAEGVIICLIPDKAYRDARPDVVDPHLTLAYFGRAAEQHPSAPSRLRSTVDRLALWAKPINAVANGLAVFIDSPHSVMVDIVDSTALASMYVDLLHTYPNTNGSVALNRTHGFTPHMTLKKLDDADHVRLVVGDLERVEFTFTAVGLWYGDEKYEVEFHG